MLKSKNKIICFVLFLISLIYYLSSCYINTSNDGSHYALVSALVNKHSVIINEYVNYTGFVDYAEKNGNYYSDRLPGNAFLMVPFYALGNLIEVVGLSNINVHKPLQEVTVILLPNICCILAILFLYNLYRYFHISQLKSLVLTVVFAFSTLVWQESTHVFSHAPSMCFVFIAIYYLIKAPTIYCKEYYLFVTLLSYSSIIELQNILLFMPCIAYLFFTKKIDLQINKQNVKTLFITSVIFLSIISLLLIYNYKAFHEISLKSNKYNPVFPEEISFLSSLSGDFWLGIDTLFTNFLNPRFYFNIELGVKNEIPGLLVTSPILITSLIGFYFFIKKYPKEAFLFISIIVINVLIAAFHKTVLVRHIFTITPFLYFPIVFFVQAVLQVKIKTIRVVLFATTVLLSLISILRVYYVTNTYWGRELINMFPFTKELGIYGIYIGILIISYFVIKKTFPKIIDSIIKIIQ
jgi:hypothetical protein